MDSPAEKGILSGLVVRMNATETYIMVSVHQVARSTFWYANRRAGVSGASSSGMCIVLVERHLNREGSSPSHLWYCSYNSEMVAYVGASHCRH